MHDPNPITRRRLLAAGTLASAGAVAAPARAQQLLPATEPMPFVNVRDFRTPGDADDTAAFRAATASARAVFIPDERATILSADVTVPAGTRIFGAGRSSVIRTDHAIVLKSRTEVDHLYLTTRSPFTRGANGLPTTPGLRCHLYAYDAPARVEDVRVHHVQGDGLEVMFHMVDRFELSAFDFKGGWYGAVGYLDCTDSDIHDGRVRFSRKEGCAAFGGADIRHRDVVSSHHGFPCFFSYGAAGGGRNTGAVRLSYDNCEASHCQAYDGFDVNGTGNDVWTFHTFSNLRSHSNAGWGFNFTGSGNQYSDLLARENGALGYRFAYDTDVAPRRPHRAVTLRGLRAYDNNTAGYAPGTAQAFHCLIDQLHDSVVTGCSMIQPPTGTALEQCLKVTEHANCHIHDNVAFSLQPAQAGTDMISLTAASGRVSRVYNNRGRSSDLGASDHGISPGPVVTPQVASPWTAYGRGFEEPGYFKDGAGIVHLAGSLMGGPTTEGTVLFTLPPGFRPAGHRDFAVASGSAYGQVRVLADGRVQVIRGASASLALDGISFRVAG